MGGLVVREGSQPSQRVTQHRNEIQAQAFLAEADPVSIEDCITPTVEAILLVQREASGSVVKLLYNRQQSLVTN